ncbi:MAG: 50S ribosomal protein L10 [Candidatus Dormibacteria bacterium]
MADTPSDGAAAVRAGPRKQAAVADLTERLTRATSAIVTDYRSLTVKQLQELRSTLRPDGVEYVVVKNTLARRAAAAAGLEQFSPALVGPVGLALGYGELSAPARLLNDYFKANRRLPMVAGMVERQLLDAEGVKTLATLPSREALFSQLAGTMASPMTRLAGSLASVPATLASALDSYRQRLEAA